VSRLTPSEGYALAAALALLVLTWLDNAVLMLIGAALGLAAGVWVARRGEVRRAAYFAMAGCAVAAVFAGFVLMR
jgi:hypothetical protein